MEKGDLPVVRLGFFKDNRGFLPDFPTESTCAKVVKDKTIPSPRNIGIQLKQPCLLKWFNYLKANLIKFSTVASGLDFNIVSKLFSAAILGKPKVTKAAKASCLLP